MRHLPAMVACCHEKFLRVDLASGEQTAFKHLKAVQISKGIVAFRALLSLFPIVLGAHSLFWLREGGPKSTFFF